MTAGQIAGLIAAIAFVVLVCFIGMFLSFGQDTGRND